MSALDTFLSDTAGVVWRASTGSVDPWTKAELIDQQTQAQIQAGADPATAAAQAQQDVTNTLSTFTLGGSDQLGADPSQAKLSLPSLEALKAAFGSLTNDAGTGCGITNIAGCVTIPSWAWWVAGGAAVLIVLSVLGPYVGLLKRGD